jgi:hypothetical protein
MDADISGSLRIKALKNPWNNPWTEVSEARQLDRLTDSTSVGWQKLNSLKTVPYVMPTQIVAKSGMDFGGIRAEQVSPASPTLIPVNVNRNAMRVPERLHATSFIP